VKKLLVILFCLGLLGCASVSHRDLYLNTSMKGLDLSQESIALMTIKLSNQFRPTFQPFILWLGLKRIVGAEGNYDWYDYWPDKGYKEVRHEYNEYLFSMRLPPNQYVLTSIKGKNFLFHVCSNVEIGPREIVYLGRMEATLHKRTDPKEPAAAGVIPLIDAMVTGYGYGSFDVKIYDRYEEDIAMFKEEYPVLAGREIRKNIISLKDSDFPKCSPK
jgi:hypothetical protein